MQSKILNRRSIFIDSPDKKVLLCVALITVFCFSYIMMHPYHANQEATSKVAPAANTATPTVSATKESPLKTDNNLPTLSSVKVNDDASGVVSSTNTSSPQNNSGSSSVSNQVTPDTANVNLQASQTTGDPNSMNISVPKKVVNQLNSLTNLIIK